MRSHIGVRRGIIVAVLSVVAVVTVGVGTAFADIVYGGVTLSKSTALKFSSPPGCFPSMSNCTAVTSITVSSPAGTFTAGHSLAVTLCNGATNTSGSGCDLNDALFPTANPDGSMSPQTLKFPGGPNPGTDASLTCPPAGANIAAGYTCLVAVTDLTITPAGSFVRLHAVYFKAPKPTVTKIGGGNVSVSGSGLACGSAPTSPVTPCAAGEGFKVFKLSTSGVKTQVGSGTATTSGTYSVGSASLGAGTWKVFVQGNFSGDKSAKTSITI